MIKLHTLVCHPRDIRKPVPREPRRFSPCDTFVFVWQTSAAQKEHPTSAAALRDVVDGFHASRPEQSGSKRKKWKNRKWSKSEKRSLVSTVPPFNNDFTHFAALGLLLDLGLRRGHKALCFVTQYRGNI